MLELLRAAVQARLNIVDLRRHRRRQNHPAQRSVQLHLGKRTHRHHRRFGRTAAAPGSRRPPRNSPAQRRRQGRHPPARAGYQRSAYAPRPHRPRRGPRRGSHGHAAGHEHRPRRLPHHHSRQHPRATACPAWKPCRMMGDIRLPEKAIRSRSPPPFTSSCRSPV